MRCSFCNKEIKEGTGIEFVKTDGTILFFCSSKCEKNKQKLKRSPTKVKWVKKKHKTGS